MRVHLRLQMRQNKTRQQPDVTTAYKSRIRERFCKWAVSVKLRLAREPFRLRPRRTSLHHSSSNQMAAVTSCFQSLGSRSSLEGCVLVRLEHSRVNDPNTSDPWLRGTEMSSFAPSSHPARKGAEVSIHSLLLQEDCSLRLLP